MVYGSWFFVFLPVFRLLAQTETKSGTTLLITSSKERYGMGLNH